MIQMAQLLVGPIAALLGKVIPDKDQRERMAHEIATMAEDQSHEISKLQVELNKVEAAHKSLFVAGWRPACGWCCVIAMANNFIVIPYVPAAQPLDLSVMLPVLMGMLGLGAYRSYEKVNGVSREK